MKKVDSAVNTATAIDNPKKLHTKTIAGSAILRLDTTAACANTTKRTIKTTKVMIPNTMVARETPNREITATRDARPATTIAN